MTAYRLHVLRAALVSRGEAKAAWDEADRIEAEVWHAGVLDALTKIGVLVDVDDSEADSGTVRWLLWAKDTLDPNEVLRATPLGHFGVLKLKSLDFDNAPVTREWLERIRKERWSDPEPPPPGNLLEQLLEMARRKELLKSSADLDYGGLDFSGAVMWLVLWTMYCSLDLTDKGGGTLESRVQSREDQRTKLLNAIRDIRRLDGALAREATQRRQRRN